MKVQCICGTILIKKAVAEEDLFSSKILRVPICKKCENRIKKEYRQIGYDEGSDKGYKIGFNKGYNNCKIKMQNLDMFPEE